MQQISYALGYFLGEEIRAGVEHDGVDVDIESVIAGFRDGLFDTASLVAMVNHDPTGAPSVSGTAAEDQVLTAEAGTLADADGLGAISYQWQRSPDGVNFSDIAGATGANYTLVDADVGQQVRVVASYTDGGGTAESVASAPGSAVSDPATLTGTAGADVLEGSSLNDTLLGLGGDDTLRGHGGDDHLDGGTGADVMEGGAGDDT